MEQFGLMLKPIQVQDVDGVAQIMLEIVHFYKNLSIN
jgi:hypothetical protein